MGNRSMFVGMDVHKETIDISVAEGGRQGEVRHYGVIPTDLEALDKVVRALRAKNQVLHLLYEAGPCGFGIHRHLTTRGEDCVVVSPSMVPKRSGERVKTDRRDSVSLARLHRAGELRAIHIPDTTDEAIRDLVRGRADAVVVATPGEVSPEGVSVAPGPALSRSRGVDAPVSALVGGSLVRECGAAPPWAAACPTAATALSDPPQHAERPCFRAWPHRRCQGLLRSNVSVMNGFEFGLS